MQLNEYRHLLAELKAVEDFIAETPPELVIDLLSWRHRLAVIQAEIDAAVVDEPTTMLVGRPQVANERRGNMATDEVQSESAHPAAVDR